MNIRHNAAASFYYFTEVRFAGRYYRAQTKGNA